MIIYLPKESDDMSKKKIKILRVANQPATVYNFCNGLFRKMSNDFEIVVIASPGPELGMIEERDGVRTIAVPIERPIAIRKDIISLIKLIKAFRREKPDVVHGVVGGKASFLSMIASRLLRVPIRIYTFTGMGSVYKTGVVGVVQRTADRISCKCATHIIPESFGVKADLEKHHITDKPLKVLGNGNIRGIDAEYYKSSPSIIAASNEIKKKIGGDFIFCFVGRIVRDKGINELVQAFTLLNKKEPQTRLVLVGGYDNGLDSIAPETLSEINNNSSIFSPGLQKDVRPWLQASNCFVLPSYREGMPNSVLEAGAMGVPSVVTDINGSREIIINNKNGLIVPPKDMKSLYNAMTYMYLNKNETEIMASNSRGLILSRFEQNYVHNCLLQYYNEILEDYKKDSYE